MKFIDAYKRSEDWRRKVSLISMYHLARLSKNKNWKLSDSAKYFGLSIGLISESLNLSKNWDLIENCTSRNEALKRIKNG